MDPAVQPISSGSHLLVVHASTKVRVANRKASKLAGGGGRSTSQSSQ